MADTAEMTRLAQEQAGSMTPGGSVEMQTGAKTGASLETEVRTEAQYRALLESRQRRESERKKRYKSLLESYRIAWTPGAINWLVSSGYMEPEPGYYSGVAARERSTMTARGGAPTTIEPDYAALASSEYTAYESRQEAGYLKLRSDLGRGQARQWQQAQADITNVANLYRMQFIQRYGDTPEKRLTPSDYAAYQRGLQQAQAARVTEAGLLTLESTGLTAGEIAKSTQRAYQGAKERTQAEISQDVFAREEKYKREQERQKNILPDTLNLTTQQRFELAEIERLNALFADFMRTDFLKTREQPAREITDPFGETEVYKSAKGIGIVDLFKNAPILGDVFAFGQAQRRERVADLFATKAEQTGQPLSQEEFAFFTAVKGEKTEGEENLFGNLRSQRPLGIGDVAVFNAANAILPGAGVALAMPFGAMVNKQVPVVAEANAAVNTETWMKATQPTIENAQNWLIENIPTPPIPYGADVKSGAVKGIMMSPQLAATLPYGFDIAGRVAIGRPGSILPMAGMGLFSQSESFISNPVQTTTMYLTPGIAETAIKKSPFFIDSPAYVGSRESYWVQTGRYSWEKTPVLNKYSTLGYQPIFDKYDPASTKLLLTRAAIQKGWIETAAGKRPTFEPRWYFGESKLVNDIGSASISEPNPFGIDSGILGPGKAALLERWGARNLMPAEYAQYRGGAILKNYLSEKTSGFVKPEQYNPLEFNLETFGGKGSVANRAILEVLQKPEYRGKVFVGGGGVATQLWVREGIPSRATPYSDIDVWVSGKSTISKVSNDIVNVLERTGKLGSVSRKAGSVEIGGEIQNVRGLSLHLIEEFPHLTEKGVFVPVKTALGGEVFAISRDYATLYKMSGAYAGLVSTRGGGALLPTQRTGDLPDLFSLSREITASRLEQTPILDIFGRRTGEYERTTDMTFGFTESVRQYGEELKHNPYARMPTATKRLPPWEQKGRLPSVGKTVSRTFETFSGEDVISLGNYEPPTAELPIDIGWMGLKTGSATALQFAAQAGGLPAEAGVLGNIALWKIINKYTTRETEWGQEYGFTRNKGRVGPRIPQALQEQGVKTTRHSGNAGEMVSLYDEEAAASIRIGTQGKYGRGTLPQKVRNRVEISSLIGGTIVGVGIKREQYPRKERDFQRSVDLNYSIPVDLNYPTRIFVPGMFGYPKRNPPRKTYITEYPTLTTTEPYKTRTPFVTGYPVQYPVRDYPTKYPTTGYPTTEYPTKYPRRPPKTPPGTPPFTPPPHIPPPNRPPPEKPPYAQFPINYVDVAHPISGVGRTLFSIEDIPTSRLRKAQRFMWFSSGDVPAGVRRSRPRMTVTRPVRGQKATTEAVVGAYTMQTLRSNAGFDLSAGTIRGKKGRKKVFMDFGFKGFD